MDSVIDVTHNVPVPFADTMGGTWGFLNPANGGLAVPGTLTLDAQGMSPVMLSMAKLLPATSRAAGDSFWVNQTRDVHTKTATAYGVITVTDPYDATTQLLGGRLLQRLHLNATHRALALQHMNQITERIDRERATGVPPTFLPRLAQLLPPGRQPLAAFRLGYAMRCVHDLRNSQRDG